MNHCQAKSNEIGNIIWTGAFSTEIWKCYHVQFYKLAISKKSFSLKHNKKFSASPLSLRSLTSGSYSEFGFHQWQALPTTFLTRFLRPSNTAEWPEITDARKADKCLPGPSPIASIVKAPARTCLRAHTERQRHKDSIFSGKIDFMCKTLVRKNWKLTHMCNFREAGLNISRRLKLHLIASKPNKCCLT